MLRASCFCFRWMEGHKALEGRLSIEIQDVEDHRHGLLPCGMGGVPLLAGHFPSVPTGRC